MCFNELSTDRLESANPCRVSTDGRNTQRVSGPAYSGNLWVGAHGHREPVAEV